MRVISLAVIFAGCTGVWALNNGLGRAPAMGWNSWNWFGCNNRGHGTLNEALIKNSADAVASNGMKEIGYTFINVDDCWAEANRDPRDGMVASRANFPNGMKAVADYVHAKGLKIGIYSDVALLTCAKTMPGLYQHEMQDADTFVAWGIDYIKLDFCGAETWDAKKTYTDFRDTLKKAVDKARAAGNTVARDILFSVCNWGRQNPWTWGAAVANSWRTTGDISINWGRTMSLLDLNAPLYPWSGIGAWNDADMLEVGNGLTQPQDRAHFSLWCMLASPLIAGNDILNMSGATKAILMNTEVLAIDQDTLGGFSGLGQIQGRRVVSTDDGLEVWVKKLRNTVNPDYAILFFNRSKSAASPISITTTQIIDSVGGGMAIGKTYDVRDLWAHADVSPWTAGGTFTSPAVPLNDVFMVRLNARSLGVQYRRENMAKRGISICQLRRGIVLKSLKQGEATVALMDMKGSCIDRREIAGPFTHEIKTGGLGTGVYLISIACGEYAWTERVLVK